MMEEKGRNKLVSNEQHSQNVFAKLWRLFTRGLSWLLILPILFYRQFISPFTPPSCRLPLPARSMVGKQS